MKCDCRDNNPVLMIVPTEHRERKIRYRCSLKQLTNTVLNGIEYNKTIKVRFEIRCVDCSKLYYCTTSSKQAKLLVDRFNGSLDKNVFDSVLEFKNEQV